MTKRRKYLIPITAIALIAIFILLPQIYVGFVPLGSDMSFHYNRFYEVAQQIETGKFNYFQSLYGFNGSGRIVNALYGYDMAFINGILLYLTKSWLKFQLISSFFCLFVAGMGTYAVARKLKMEQLYAIMAASFYMSCAGVIYYVRAQGFSGWGSALLPFVFIQAIRAVTDKRKPIHVVNLAISVSLLLNTHVLSALIGVVAIVPFYLVSFFKAGNKGKWLGSAFLAVGLTILMSLNTLIAYFEVSLTNHLLRPYIPDSFLLESLKLDVGAINGNHTLGLLFGFPFIFLIVYVLLNRTEICLLNRLMTGVGAFFLLVSTTIFPWDKLMQLIPALTMLQFPFRLSIVAFILLPVVFFDEIGRIKQSFQLPQQKMVTATLLTLTILISSSAHLQMEANAQKWLRDPLSMGNNSSSYTAKEIRNHLRSSDLSYALKTIQKGTSDYLPMKKERAITDSRDFESLESYKKYRETILNNQVGFEREITDQGEIKLSWENEESNSKLVPIIIYQNSRVKLNGKLLPKEAYDTTEFGTLIVAAEKGQNVVEVGYEPLFPLRLVLWIKMGTIVLVLVYVIGKKIKKGKSNSTRRASGRKSFSNT
ncbi:hypothetical protein ACYSNO_02170 [Enterococcus sp. LJL98]